MTWRRKSPGYQQSWYWCNSHRIFKPRHQKGSDHDRWHVWHQLIGTMRHQAHQPSQFSITRWDKSLLRHCQHKILNFFIFSKVWSSDKSKTQIFPKWQGNLIFFFSRIFHIVHQKLIITIIISISIIIMIKIIIYVAQIIPFMSWIV